MELNKSPRTFWCFKLFSLPRPSPWKTPIARTFAHAQPNRAGREFPFLILVHRILVKLENVNHSRPTSSALMAFEAGTASLRSCLHTLPVQPSPLHRPVDRLIALPDVELLSRARSMLRHDFVQELPSTVLVLTLLTQRQQIHLAPPCRRTLHDNLCSNPSARLGALRAGVWSCSRLRSSLLAAL